MAELVQENLVLLIIALLIGVAVAWYVFAYSRKTTVEREEGADESSAKVARRNQALIDSAPSAIPVPPPTPEAVGGAGVAVAAAVEEAAVHSAPPAGEGDDLTLIKGVGPKLVATLHDLGVTTYAQIAAWDDAEIDRVDAQLGRFEGRIRRDSWVEQAQLLASGDRTAYEAKFGRT